jgi:hypothetical protein
MVSIRGACEAAVGAIQGALVACGCLAFLFLALEGSGLARADPALTGAAARVDPVGVPPAPEQPAGTGARTSSRHRALATYLAHRYRVATDATVPLVTQAYAVGSGVGLDPLLILAVICVESGFNPIAASAQGAKGLMQVIPRFHYDKLAAHGGENAVLDPRINMLVGAQILKEYIGRAGSLEGGLQMYNGAAADPARGYAQRVGAERQHLEQALPRTGRRGAADVPAPVHSLLSRSHTTLA